MKLKLRHIFIVIFSNIWYCFVLKVGCTKKVKSQKKMNTGKKMKTVNVKKCKVNYKCLYYFIIKSNKIIISLNF